MNYESIIKEKFKSIPATTFVDIHRTNKEINVTILYKSSGDYNSNIIDEFLETEYTIRKMFPELNFNFRYFPASIETMYEFAKNKEEIINFIKENNLEKVLTEAPSIIASILKNVKMKLILELHKDPEEPRKILFLLIKMPCKTEEILKYDKVLFHYWFSKIDKNFTLNFNYSIEPVNE
jgi:hypothetical protein